jgi:hypothetical protein
VNLKFQVRIRAPGRGDQCGTAVDSDDVGARLVELHRPPAMAASQVEHPQSLNVTEFGPEEGSEPAVEAVAVPADAARVDVGHVVPPGEILATAHSRQLTSPTFLLI